MPMPLTVEVEPTMTIAAPAPSPASGCRICVPLLASTVAEMLQQMSTAHSLGADLVELRIDRISGFNASTDLPVLLRGRPLPVIVTYRPSWEREECTGSEPSRLEALQLAVALGADFVEIEFQVAAEFIASLKDERAESDCKVIVTLHDLKRTPSIEEFTSMVARVQSTGADVVKFVTTANNVTDVAAIFQILSRSQVPTIAVAMNERGTISWLLSPKFGGFMTFGSLQSGMESVPGQLTLSTLRNVYGLQRINLDTKIYGLLSNPVGHSKGPIIHNAAFREAGYNGIYVPFLADDLNEFFKVYNGSDFSGFSVGLPYKEVALQCCDEVEPLAKRIGAVNTIVRRKTDGKLIGYNTDCDGAISAIEDALRGLSSGSSERPLEGKYVLVIGAGGAGKAISYGAKDRGAKVFIANRDYDKAEELADLLGGEAVEMTDLCTFRPGPGMVLANASTVGMQPNVDQTPIPKEALTNYELVFDAVYTPRETRLLKEAKEAGICVVSGLEMFIRQAMKQFMLFTEQQPPEKLMREIMTNL